VGRVKTAVTNHL